jgi:predicted RNase H-like nuclease (RuvC/YqgF family)
LNGTLIALGSERNLGINDLLKKLACFKISIVACDTNPPPKQAKKLAAAFRSRLYFPKHSLTFFEKIRLAGGEGRNDHERDAIASARKAFHALAENKMRLLSRKLKKVQRTDEEEAIGERVLRGERIHDLLAKKLV